ncbi:MULTISPECIES: hypothetical protein [unclassified Novosphingobium]|uniref:hypothetical protein n=1 Tax=unclassified Novosphingobium TaxID=2644732 RepID=UPI00145BA9E8|nr:MULTISPECIES: hypothetical protein [unclassified Novosphingobium]MBB3356371.1 PBP1b-binding outer membrane lipoprotein LpoB [Novosphingobium sp. BK256]MBB3372772.1 PBP1b-binding outer membrane lipoprotein LpoB [Novosphingobium sp. BK280]MBB3377140.1 PBP1b-binding outer membrane lipoprotein LpoB [Novosphingobium sp. BK258]MBB3419449.1 PBP1b-binding outer membrane lipoprotein LpoB [Novosphingobium sp. BK267]MBB3448734.1 PBP1b-binding outer membrane lipoprotein LpoB [Novosphingobium sp. BK352]
MKKLFPTAIAGVALVAAALSLSACGRSDDASTEASPDNVEMPADELPATDVSAAAPAPVDAPAADPSAAAQTAEDAARSAADNAAAAADAAKAAAAAAEAGDASANGGANSNPKM